MVDFLDKGSQAWRRPSGDMKVGPILVGTRRA
jgi:hypothetical protein